MSRQSTTVALASVGLASLVVAAELYRRQRRRGALVEAEPEAPATPAPAAPAAPAAADAQQAPVCSLTAKSLCHH